MMQNSRVFPKGLGLIADFLSQLKLSNLLAPLIIYFSATQFGLHFWPLSSLVYGIRIDYLAPTLYFLDILIILFLALKRSDLVGCKPNQKPTRSDLVGVVIPILLTNLLYSQNPLSTLSWSLHLVMYFLFFATLGSDLKGRAQPAYTKVGRSDPKVVIQSALSLSLLFQTILALTQVFLGHSVGSLLYYLGERTIAVGSPNIATGTIWGQVILRAYGTFGHPNVLAGWSVIVFLIILFLSPVTKRSDLVGCKPNQKPTRSDLVGVVIPLLLTSLLVLLTQSRSAALTLFGIIVPFYLIKNLKLKIIYFLVLTLLVFRFGILNPTRSDLSQSQRLDLQGQSLKVVSHYPIFGTGAQASISTYPSVVQSFRLLQPDHNSFTLFFSWFGLFGALALLSVLKGPDLLPLLPLLPLLLLDHYLLTSPQGLFMVLFYFFVLS